MHRRAPRLEGAADRVANADDYREISAGKRRFFVLHKPSIDDRGRTIPRRAFNGFYAWWA